MSPLDLLMSRVNQHMQHHEHKHVICPHHPEEGEYITFMQEDGSWSECPACRAKREFEKRIEKEKAESALKKLNEIWDSASLPIAYQNVTFESVGNSTRFAKEFEFAKKFVKSFDAVREKGVSLTILGSAGTGKTTLACCIANAIKEQKKGVVFITVRDLHRLTIDAMKNEASEKKLKTLNKADLLIIDEVGYQKETDSEIFSLSDVICYRYDMKLPNIVLGNITPDQTTRFMGERVAERLGEKGRSQLLIMTGESYRNSPLTKA